MIDLATYQRQDIKKEAKASAKGSSLMEFLNKDIKLFKTGFSDKKKERFYSELNILFDADLDIKTSLELIAGQQKKEEDRLLFENIKDIVVGGKNLSEALEMTKQFSAYEYQSIKIGEESGKLSLVLVELADYFNRKIAQKRQMISALSYPAIVLVVALGVVGLMLSIVVPVFADMYKNLKSELPILTQYVMKASKLMSNYLPLIILAIIGSVIFFFKVKEKVWFRKHSSAVLLKIPTLGSLIQKIYLARFCKSMNLLLSAKTPLVTAIDMVKNMVGFYPIEHSLETIKDDILKGGSLYQSLSAFPIYERRMLSLIKVGEEVNQLDVIFGKLSKQYMDDVDYQSGQLKTIIEPVLMIFIGLFVGVIVVALYLPMFNLVTAFH
ncbi:MAG: type II secretion system F family protein [Bacteroidetes bacterium]|nr:type II secretion system F family protein [Bacteroidota bacterium]